MGRDRYHFSVRRASRTPADAHDRRRSHRYPVVEDRALLGWWEGTEYRQVEARLLNVSQTGTMIIANGEPPQGVSTYICLEGPPASEWIESRVVGIKKLRRGWHEVRLEFRKNCPYSVFRTAVYGDEALKGFPSVPLDECDQENWR